MTGAKPAPGLPLPGPVVPWPRPVPRLADGSAGGPGGIAGGAVADCPDGAGPARLAGGGGEVPLRTGAGPALRDRSGIWLGTAAAGLAVLAGAAATVSFSAQYEMVHAARGLPAVAALEAAIPDAAALIFASLGIALALQGRRAVRSRLLNLASVGASVAMNVLAASPGWRDLAIWAMPPVAYALASDTLIGVVRSTTIARHQAVRQVAGDETSPVAVLGRLLLWPARLVLAPVSTLARVRSRVLGDLAAGTGGGMPAPALAAADRLETLPPPPAQVAKRQTDGTRTKTKTARFLALVTERHGPLGGIDLASVGRICADLAPAVPLDPGAARTALRRAVLVARDGGAR